MCDICRNSLKEPFILCADCKSISLHRPQHRCQICVKCFASGIENIDHKNTHKYTIVHDKIKVFSNTEWTAQEESLLLNLLERFGFNNWLDISRAMGIYSAEECRDHYINNYFKGLFCKSCGLPSFSYSRIENPYLFRSNSFDPPRNKLNETQNRYVADYRYARSEFDTPFDGSAENIICELHPSSEWNVDYQDISDKLNLALVRAYNNRLR